MFDSTGNFYYGESLYHHGVKGMKWGVRRYQNPDGSLTAKGKKRDSEGRKSDKNSKSSNAKRVAKGAAVVAGLALAGVGLHKASKYQKALGQRAIDQIKAVDEVHRNAYSRLADIHLQKAFDLAKDGKDAKSEIHAYRTALNKSAKLIGRKPSKSEIHDTALDIFSADLKGIRRRLKGKR